MLKVSLTVSLVCCQVLPVANSIQDFMSSQIAHFLQCLTSVDHYIPEGLIQKQDPKDALLCRAW